MLVIEVLFSFYVHTSKHGIKTHILLFSDKTRICLKVDNPEANKEWSPAQQELTNYVYDMSKP